MTHDTSPPAQLEAARAMEAKLVEELRAAGEAAAAQQAAMEQLKKAMAEETRAMQVCRARG